MGRAPKQTFLQADTYSIGHFMPSPGAGPGQKLKDRKLSSAHFVFIPGAVEPGAFPAVGLGVGATYTPDPKVILMMQRPTNE